MNVLWAILILLPNFLTIFALPNDPVVEIRDGLVRGSVFRSRKGRFFSSFQGIPYGQPPIGRLRFSDPLPMRPWRGTYLANKSDQKCLQMNNGKIQGNEDCLYLNVHTPRLFNSTRAGRWSKNILMPVMVWIHGGGFSSGDGNSYKPTYLLDKDIVLVTINYRLGVLGYLTTGDSVAPGNFGLKDQVLALKWVQKNIKAFGGNPYQVTIFGQDAGAASVTYHALSKASRGLFKQYIAQSGNALAPWSYRDRSLFKSDVNNIAAKIGCPIRTSRILIECLRYKNAYKLVNLTSFNVLDYPKLSWVPTNEVRTYNAFLTENPVYMIKKDKLKDYPSMTGINANEGLYISGSLYQNLPLTEIENAVNKSIWLDTNYYLQLNRAKQLGALIEKYYFSEKIFRTYNKNKLLNNFTLLAGDTQFNYPHFAFIEKISKKSFFSFSSRSPVYSYVFSYRGSRNSLSLNYGLDQNLGVSHGDELQYLFELGPPRPIRPVEAHIIDLMIDLWTSFATRGKPVSNYLAYPNFWEPYGKKKRFIQFGSSFNNTLATIFLNQADTYHTFADRITFWKRNLPLV